MNSETAHETFSRVYPDEGFMVAVRTIIDLHGLTIEQAKRIGLYAIGPEQAPFHPDNSKNEFFEALDELPNENGSGELGCQEP